MEELTSDQWIEKYRWKDGWHDLRFNPDDVPKTKGSVYGHRVVCTTDGLTVQRCGYIKPWREYEEHWRMHNGQEPHQPIIGWCETTYPPVPERFKRGL